VAKGGALRDCANTILFESVCLPVNALQSGMSDMRRLTLRNVTLSDAGWYSCIVSNKFGQIRQSVWVEVLTDRSLRGTTSDSHMMYLVTAVVVIIGLLMIAAGVLSTCCWIRCRPPKNRPLILHDNPHYWDVVVPFLSRNGAPEIRQPER